MRNHGSRPLRKLLALSLLISSGEANELVKQFYTDFINAYTLRGSEEAFSDFIEINELAVSLLPESDGLDASIERREAFRKDPDEELPKNLHYTLRTLPRWFSDKTLEKEATDLSESFVYYSSPEDFQNGNYAHPFIEKHLPALENLVTRRFTFLTANRVSKIRPELAKGRTPTWRWITVSLFYVSCRFLAEVLLYTELMKFHYGKEKNRAWTEKHEIRLGGKFPLTDDDMQEFGQKILHIAGVVHELFCAAGFPNPEDCENMTDTGKKFWEKVLGENVADKDSFPHKTLVTTFRDIAYPEDPN